MPNQFNREKVLREGQGFDFRPSTNVMAPEGAKERWISIEEVNRNDKFDENWHLYLGLHGVAEGGPFKHPYDRDKVESEGIDYVVVNILGHITDTFAALELGEDFGVNTEDEAAEKVLKSIKCFEQIVWDAVVQASAYGWVGLQPSVEEEEGGGKKHNLAVIRPHNLRINWFPARDEIKSIDKMLLFDDPQSKSQGGMTLTTEKQSAKTQILLLERHFKGRFETGLFRVQGPWIMEVLDLSWFTENIDETVFLQEEGDTELDDFQITILVNDRIGRQFRPDYSPASKVLQKQLNNRETQVARILDIHSSPKMVLPRTMVKKDRETGRPYIDLHGRDAFFVDPENNEVTPQYLTWDGQLEAARQQKLSILQGLLTMTKMAPSLLSFTDIIGATSADTFSKMRLNLQTTLKVIERKRCFLAEALTAVLSNTLAMAGIKVADGSLQEDVFEISFPDPIPSDRVDEIDEMSIRKQGMLISSRTAIQRLDNVTEDLAQEEYDRILEERDREGTSGGFDFPPGLRVPKPGMDEEDLENLRQGGEDDPTGTSDGVPGDDGGDGEA